MICPRCGTEHDDPNNVCPRCGFGRPKIRRPWPRWARWTAWIAGILLVVGLGFFVFRTVFYNSRWMNGSWEGGSLAITFNAEDGTFLLSNGDTVLNGNYIARSDSFELQADDGNSYYFRYTRVGVNKMRVSFIQNETTVRVMLTHMTGENEETEEEEENENEDDEYLLDDYD